MALDAWKAATVAENSDFQKRVKYFMQKGAVAVLAEVQTTANHVARSAYAATVVDGTASVLQHAIAVLANETLFSGGDITLQNEGGFGITDSDLEFAVNEHWNAMSGVSHGPAT
jgi:hypothetical protein